MDKKIFSKNGISFEVERYADEYGQLTVVARKNELQQKGKIPGDRQTVYPRIQFFFCRERWLHKAADRCWWSVGDHEAVDFINRPTDNCEFDLTPEEVEFLNDWRNAPKPAAKPAPKPATREESMDISSGFGLMGRGSDDHNMGLERPGTSTVIVGCSWNHGTRYDECCANCHKVTEICNDCSRCKKCHGE